MLLLYEENKQLEILQVQDLKKNGILHFRNRNRSQEHIKSISKQNYEEKPLLKNFDKTHNYNFKEVEQRFQDFLSNHNFKNLPKQENTIKFENSIKDAPKNLLLFEKSKSCAKIFDNKTMPQSPSSQSKSTIKASIRGDESPSKKKKEKFEYLYSGLSNNKLTTKRTMYANSIENSIRALTGKQKSKLLSKMTSNN